jgi:prepilin-type N-terminal cleavage/methylation domain-containing protein
MTTRRGFTLVEVMVALVMLTIVALGLGRFVGSFLRSTSDSNVRIVATSVANERLELIRADPRYTRLRTLYGAATPGADTLGFPGFPTMRRRTVIIRDTTSTARRDLTTITVRVTHPSMRDTVSLTIARARP